MRERGSSRIQVELLGGHSFGSPGEGRERRLISKEKNRRSNMKEVVRIKNDRTSHTIKKETGIEGKSSKQILKQMPWKKRLHLSL